MNGMRGRAHLLSMSVHARAHAYVTFFPSCRGVTRGRSVASGFTSLTYSAPVSRMQRRRPIGVTLAVETTPARQLVSRASGSSVALLADKS